jgi:hypothetical protein
MNEGAGCETCRTELVLLTRDGEPIEHPKHPGRFKTRCACGLGMTRVEDRDQVMALARREEEPPRRPRIYLDPTPPWDPYGEQED